MQPDIEFVRDTHLPHRLIPVTEEEAGCFPHLPSAHQQLALALAETRKFIGAPDSTLLVPTLDGQWVFTGLGPAADIDPQHLADAIALGYKALREAGGAELALLLPSTVGTPPWSEGEASRVATEALLMAAYRFDKYRSAEQTPVKLQVCGTSEEAAAGVRQGSRVAEAVALARDLINEPAAVAHPGYLVARARDLTAEDTRVRVIQGESLRDQGYGAVYGVGRAGEHPPALVALEWQGGEGPTLALVGKGVTFDTGGLDLKPSQYMALMKKDLGGAAIVLGAFQGIRALGLPLRLVAVLGLAENSVDARSYRPGDILRSKSGKTIEITNTDAEGRVVLADAMALAQEYSPAYLVDLATLTGACRVALGKEVMGLFCDHGPLTEALEASAAYTGEAVWRLPLWNPYRKKMDSPVADLVNAAPDGMGGAITAALFLREFAGSVAWAHLDCYAWSDGDSSLFPKGGSGAGVRLLIDLARRLAREAH